MDHRERPRRPTYWINRSTAGNPGARTKAEENFKTMIALRRIGDPKEAGEVIAWLCSDAASCLTGHSMIADRGLAAHFR
jgi:glucose 1-dehydrogenase